MVFRSWLDFGLSISNIKDTYLSHEQTMSKLVYNQQVNRIYGYFMMDISMDIYGRYMELSLSLSLSLNGLRKLTYYIHIHIYIYIHDTYMYIYINANMKLSDNWEVLCHHVPTLVVNTEALKRPLLRLGGREASERGDVTVLWYHRIYYNTNSFTEYVHIHISIHI